MQLATKNRPVLNRYWRRVKKPATAYVQATIIALIN